MVARAVDGIAGGQGYLRSHRGKVAMVGGEEGAERIPALTPQLDSVDPWGGSHSDAVRIEQAAPAQGARVPGDTGVLASDIADGARSGVGMVMPERRRQLSMVPVLTHPRRRVVGCSVVEIGRGGGVDVGGVCLSGRGGKLNIATDDIR